METMTKIIALIGALLLPAAAVAEAAETAGAGGGAMPAASFYVSAKAGMNLLEDLEEHYKLNYSDTSFRENHSYTSGFLFAGAAGWKRSFFRAEAEIEYASNEWDQISLSVGQGSPVEFGPTLPLGASGTWNALSAFGNMYIDFDNRTRFTPYIFGGLGATKLSWDRLNLLYNGVSYPVRDDSGVVLAWKLGAGVAWNVWKSLSLDLSYRYLKTNGLDIENSNGSYDYTSHAVSLGGRYHF